MKSKTLRWGLVVLAVILAGLIVRTVTPSVTDMGTPGPEDQALLQSSLPPGHATFRGGWRTADMEEAQAPQAVLIECRKENAECIFTQTSVYADHFYQDIGYYKITGWTDEGAIIAEQDGECGDSTLTANVPSASAKLVTIWDPKSAEACGLAPDEVSTEWTLDDVESSSFAKVREQFYDFCVDFDLCHN